MDTDLNNGLDNGLDNNGFFLRNSFWTKFKLDFMESVFNWCVDFYGVKISILQTQ